MSNSNGNSQLEKNAELPSALAHRSQLSASEMLANGLIALAATAIIVKRSSSMILFDSVVPPYFICVRSSGGGSVDCAAPSLIQSFIVCLFVPLL